MIKKIKSGVAALRGKRVLSKLGASFLMGFLAVLFSLLIFSAYYLSSFSRIVGVGKKELAAQAYAGLQNPYRGDYLTFLVLGLDQRSTDASLLTDTILLAVVNAKTGSYLLFSIPRDLWIDDLKTKINALYYYGQKRNPDDGSGLVKNRLEKILDWPIDHVVLLKMNQMEQLVDLLGGVEVDVERSFVDREFPRDDGSNQVMKIEFKVGRQTLGGQKALQFMRSRKSLDPVEGTDEARQKRQKKVILAIKDKILSSKGLFLSPQKSAALFNFFFKQTKTTPPITVARAASFWRIGQELIDNGKQTEGELAWRGDKAVLAPTTDLVYGSWILMPKNDDWSKIKDFFKENLP